MTSSVILLPGTNKFFYGYHFMDVGIRHPLKHLYYLISEFVASMLFTIDGITLTLLKIKDDALFQFRWNRPSTKN